MPKKLRVTITQTPSSRDRGANFATLLQMIAEAGVAGSDLILLPENALFAGSNSEMADAALPLDAEPFVRLCGAARAVGTPVILGGVKRRVGASIRNSAIIIDAQGSVAGVYDKIHGFVAQLEGHTFNANAREQPGTQAVMIRLGETLIAVTICFDLRFPELYRALAGTGAAIALVPSAFTRVTGRTHWDILLRARAIENGLFIVASATIGASDLADTDPLATYGHAMIVGPWGEVISDLGEMDTGWRTIELDLAEVDRRRKQLPCLEARASHTYIAPPAVIDI